MPLETREIDRYLGRERDAHRARMTGLHRDDLLACAHQSFGEEKPGRELEVIARGAHRDRDRRDTPLHAVTPLDPYLERLLDGEQVTGDAIRVRPAPRDLDLPHTVDHARLLVVRSTR